MVAPSISVTHIYIVDIPFIKDQISVKEYRNFERVSLVELAMESSVEPESTTIQNVAYSVFYESSATFSTWRAVLITSITALNLVSNSFAIWLICKTKGELERPDVKLVLSLFCSDLMFGFALLFAVLGAWQPYIVQNQDYFRIYLFVNYVPGVVTVYSLGAIALVKMLAITRPLHFTTEVSSLRITLAITATWIAAFLIVLPILIGVPFRFYTNMIYALPSSVLYQLAAFLFVILPGFTTMFLCYRKIFLVVRDTNRKIQDIAVNDQEKQTERLFLKSIRSSKNLFIITATFLVVYGLSSSVMLVSLETDEDADSSAQFLLYWCTIPVNSWLNSILYIVLTKKIRQKVAGYFSFQTSTGASSTRPSN